MKYRSRKAFEEARRRRRRLLWLIPTCILLILIAITVVTRLEQFSVNTIVVEGGETVNEDQIEKAVDLQLDNSQLFIVSNQTPVTFPKKETEEALLEAIPSLESVDIAIENQTLTVTIKEKAPYIAVCATQDFVLEECNVVDANGNIFSTYSPEIQSEGMIPVLIQAFESEEAGIKEVQTFTFVRELIEIYSEVPQAASPSYFMLLEDGTIDAYYPSETHVRFMARRNALAQIEALETSFVKLDSLPTILDEYEYIDVRFDDRVYFKKKTDPEPVEQPTVPEETEGNPAGEENEESVDTDAESTPQNEQ